MKLKKRWYSFSSSTGHKDAKGQVLAILFGLSFASLLAEIGLRISGYCKTYSEKKLK